MGERDENRQPQNETSRERAPQDRKTNWTDFGTGFATFFTAVLLFSAPWYFLGSPFPDSLVPLLVAMLMYLAGLALALFALGFFKAGTEKTPELRQLFPGLSVSEDAWGGAYGTAFFLVIVIVIQAITWGFDLIGIGAVIAKLATYAMLVLGITQLAQAIDGFVIRPLIAAAAKGPQEFDPLINRVRRIGVFVITLIGLVAGVITIIQAF